MCQYAPEAVVRPQLQQLQWGYETELRLLGHVQIIDEGHLMCEHWEGIDVMTTQIQRRVCL